jgi:hypothetical protein
VPKDVSGYGGVNLDGLRSSPLYAAFKPQIDGVLSSPEVKGPMEKAGITESSLSALTFGIGDVSGGEPKVVLALSGSFDESKLFAVTKEQIGDRAEEKDLAGAKFLAQKGTEFGVAIGDKGVLLLGTEKLVGDALGVKAGKGDSVAKNEGLGAIAKNVDQRATMWVAMAIPAEAKAALEMIPSDYRQIGSATHVAASLDVGGDVVFKLAVKLGSKEDAEAVVAQVKGFSGMAKMFTSEVPADLKADVDAVIDSLSAEAKGDTALLGVKVSKAAVEKIAKLAKERGLDGLL